VKNPNIEISMISDKEFKRTQLDYCIMLMKKYNRIEWYRKELARYKIKYQKNGFSKSEEDIIFIGVIDWLEEEIQKEEQEYEQWSNDLITNKDSESEASKVSRFT